jgi:hypothetical protein
MSLEMTIGFWGKGDLQRHKSVLEVIMNNNRSETATKETTGPSDNGRTVPHIC